MPAMGFPGRVTGFPALCALLLLVGLTHGHAKPEAGSLPDQWKIKSSITEVQSNPMYANGTFFGKWRDNSVGCQRCNFADTKQRRNSSSASLSAIVQPWGSLTFASSTKVFSDSVLDFWVKGSGLTAISLYIKDSVTKTLSKDVRFNQPHQLPEGVTILDNDDDGFIRIQVALSSLRAVADNSTGSCGPYGVSSHFDQVVFADISGMGFNLILDDVKLVAQDVVSASSFVLPTRTLRAPVFGEDLTNLRAGKNRYIMKMKPNAVWSHTNMICRELAGQMNQPRRFQGGCSTPMSTLRTSPTGTALSWGLVALNVESAQDLEAMRSALSDSIEYFEADLTGFTTIRGLREAMQKGNQQNPTDGDVEDPVWRWSNGTYAEFTMSANSEEDEPPSTAEPSSDTDPQAVIQSVASWGLDRIDQEQLPLDNSYSSGDLDGRGVHVYILDTGVRTSHYDFKGRVGDGASALGTSVADDNGHGTHVAGTALGSVHGVAPSAILHPVKVMDAKGNGAYSNIIAGIQWVKDHKARNSIASAVISMSIAGPRSASLNDAVEAAISSGITVITAAGNNKGGDSCTMSPASAPNSITVGASTDTDAMASMSNIGSCLSLFAPGAYIASSSWKSDTAEAYMSGTSMAAPHVAGAAALYLQLRPGASPAEVKAALKLAAVQKQFESSSPQLLLNVISSRLRNAYRTLYPQPNPTPAPKPSPATAPKPSPKPAASPSPKPAPPAPAPPAPTPATPRPGTVNPSFPSAFPITPGSSFCSNCPWCMFC